MNKLELGKMKIFGICLIASFIFPQLVFAFQNACGANQIPSEAVRGGPIFDIGKRLSFSKILYSNESASIGESLEGGTKYLRFSIKIIKQKVINEELKSLDWSLIVRDSEYRIIQVLEPRDFEDSDTVWTTRISGEKVNFEFKTENKGLKIKISEFIAMPKASKNTYYSALDPEKPRYSELYPIRGNINFQDNVYKKLGNSVGLLMTSYATQSWICSGVIVAEDLFLTNWHCGAPAQLSEQDVWLDEICNSSLIDLSWDNDNISRDYKCVKPVASSKALDFALLRIKPLGDARSPTPVVIDPTRKKSLEPITIIHHPLGLPKQISVDCYMTKLGWDSPMATGVDNYDFQHNCDTAQGSSGSPVFDSDGSLIGLHHLGFGLNTEGTTCDNMNKAVWMEDIVNEIKKQAPEIAERLNYN